MDTKLKKKIVKIIVLIILIIIAALIFIYKPTEIKPTAPDPLDMQAGEVGKFLESKDFTELSVEEKLKFMDQIPANQKANLLNKHLITINQEKSRRQMRNMMNSYVAGRVDKFFELSEEEQNQMLDVDIDRFEKAHRMIQIQTRMTGSKQIIPQGGAERAEFDASISPATKAKMRIYLERMRQRKKSRR